MLVNAIANEFAAQRYTVLRQVLSQDQRHFYAEYVSKKAQAPGVRRDDPMVNGTPWLYGDPVLDLLLEMIRPSVEEVTRLALLPTYSYCRVYKKGDILERHVDRPACEISITLALDFGPSAWPFWVDAGAGAAEILLDRGDAAVYSGSQVAHWRDRFEGVFASQVFLHFVDANGPFRTWQFDRREALGLPRQ